VAGGSAVAAFAGGVAFGNQPARNAENAARCTYGCIAQPVLTASRLRAIRARLAHHLTVALRRASMNTPRFQPLILPTSGHDKLAPRSERVRTGRARHT
jgi:hypothetical protein